MDRIFKPSEGSGLDADQAILVGKEFERITEERGSLTAEILLEHASDPTHPLHAYFQWDNDKAANGFRLEQARRLIRSIKVEFVGSKEPIQVRAFVKVAGNGYMATEQALSKETWKNYVLDRALKDLKAFEMKYHNLVELSELIATMREHAKEIESNLGPPSTEGPQPAA